MQYHTIPYLDNALVCPQRLDGKRKVLGLILRRESIILLPFEVILEDRRQAGKGGARGGGGRGRNTTSTINTYYSVPGKQHEGRREGSFSASPGVSGRRKGSGKREGCNARLIKTETFLYRAGEAGGE